MTLPVSSIVSVGITVSPTFPARDGFGTLCGVTAETGVIGISERTREYLDITAVAADWDANSELYKLAETYFSQNPRPTMFKAAVRFPTAQAAQLRGGATVLPSDLVAITDGSLTLTIDGDTEEVASIDFSSVLTLSDVALILETAIQGGSGSGFTTATVVAVDDQRLVLDAGSTGSLSTIGFANAGASGTDIHELVHWEQGEATKQNGVDAETITASLNAIEAVDQDWYGLCFTKEVRDKVIINSEDAVLSAAEWCQARTKMFFNTSNDLDALDSVGAVNTIGAAIDAQNLDRTQNSYSTYPSQYPACSAAARIFTTDFSATNSVMTLKFKQLPGITVESLNPSQKATLDKYHVNAFVDVGGSSMYAEGWNASGRFTDEVHTIDWLVNAIQTNVFGFLLSRPTKVAMTDEGIAAVEQQIASALDEARNNGFIAPGYTVDGVFLERGYEINMPRAEDVSQSDVEARHLPGITFTILGAGAIHSVEISGVFER